MNEVAAREPWWVWHWDRTEAADRSLPCESLTRWRRGSFLTVYRWRFKGGGMLWLFYGPFNFCVAFGRG